MNYMTYLARLSRPVALLNAYGFGLLFVMFLALSYFRSTSFSWFEWFSGVLAVLNLCVWYYLGWVIDEDDDFDGGLPIG